MNRLTSMPACISFSADSLIRSLLPSTSSPPSVVTSSRVSGTKQANSGFTLMEMVVSLFLIILMENRRRGMFLGYGVKPLYGVGDAVRRYHGYYFSWAIIYTFWYHPIETTLGHLFGTFYILLIFLQGSLFFVAFPGLCPGLLSAALLRRTENTVLPNLGLLVRSARSESHGRSYSATNR